MPRAAIMSTTGMTDQQMERFAQDLWLTCGSLHTFTTEEHQSQIPAGIINEASTALHHLLMTAKYLEARGFGNG